MENAQDLAEGAVINTLEKDPNHFVSYQAGDQLIIIRHGSCRRQDMATTASILDAGRWIALDMEEIGDTLVERYQRFRTTVR